MIVTSLSPRQDTKRRSVVSVRTLIVKIDKKMQVITFCLHFGSYNSSGNPGWCLIIKNFVFTFFSKVHVNYLWCSWKLKSMQNDCDIVKWDESDHQFKWEWVGTNDVRGTHQSLKIKKTGLWFATGFSRVLLGLMSKLAHGYCTKNMHRSTQNSAASQVSLF